MTQQRVPVFPLPVFLLPDGKMRLRIFEPRYLKMIRIASEQDGFVINLRAKENGIDDISWGSWVAIEDFDQGADGILEVTVHCHSLVELKDFSSDETNLDFATAVPLEHWSQIPDGNNDELNWLTLSLFRVLDDHPILQKIYQNERNQSARWVVARWLELLPIDLKTKNLFAKEYNFDQARELVSSIIKK